MTKFQLFSFIFKEVYSSIWKDACANKTFKSLIVKVYMRSIKNRLFKFNNWVKGAMCLTKTSFITPSRVYPAWAVLSRSTGTLSPWFHQCFHLAHDWTGQFISWVWIPLSNQMPGENTMKHRFQCFIWYPNARIWFKSSKPVGHWTHK